jgi:hypothetical protein
MKPKFSIGQRVQFETMPIDMIVIAVNRTPKSKYQVSPFSYWCDPGYDLKPTQVYEKDLIEAPKAMA